MLYGTLTSCEGSCPALPPALSTKEVTGARVRPRHDGLSRDRISCAVAAAVVDSGVRYDSERVVRAVGDFRSSLGQVGAAAAELDDRLHRVYRDDL